MYTEGYVYEEEIVDQPVYKVIEVSEETYPSEFQKGLWLYDSVKIDFGDETLVFYYRHPNGLLIDTESVSIVYDGEQGAQYLGQFRGSGSSLADQVANCKQLVIESTEGKINDGDYYLCLNDGYIYEARKQSYNVTVDDFYQIGYDPEQPLDKRYADVVTKAISELSTDDETTLPIVKAMNVWCKSLAAQTALIQNLFSQKITLLEGENGEKGSIQSKIFIDDEGAGNFLYFGFNNNNDYSDDYYYFNEVPTNYDFYGIKVRNDNLDKGTFVYSDVLPSVRWYPSITMTGYYYAISPTSDFSTSDFLPITNNLDFDESYIDKYICIKSTFINGGTNKELTSTFKLIKSIPHGIYINTDGKCVLSDVSSYAGNFSEMNSESGKFTNARFKNVSTYSNTKYIYLGGLSLTYKSYSDSKFNYDKCILGNEFISATLENVYDTDAYRDYVFELLLKDDVKNMISSSFNVSNMSINYNVILDGDNNTTQISSTIDSKYSKYYCFIESIYDSSILIGFRLHIRPFYNNSKAYIYNFKCNIFMSTGSLSSIISI